MKIGFVKGAIASLVLFTLGSVPAFSQNMGGEIVETAEMILPDSIDGIEYFRTDYLEVNELSVMRGELQLANGLKVTGDGDFRGDVLVAGGLTVAGNPYFTGLNESVEVPGVVGMNDVGELVYIATETLLGGTPGTTDPSACVRDTDGQIISQPAKWSYNNNNIFTNPCTVNPLVGIGTHTPREALDVNGKAIITNTLAVGRSTARGALDVQGDGYFGNATRYIWMGSDPAGTFIETVNGTQALRINAGSNDKVVIGSSNSTPTGMEVKGKLHIGPNTLTSSGAHLQVEGHGALLWDQPTAGTSRKLTLGDNNHALQATYGSGVWLKTFGNNLYLNEDGSAGIGAQVPAGSNAGLYVSNNADNPLLVERGGTAVLKLHYDNVSDRTVLYTNEVNVTISGFPDYVFAADYRLKSPLEVESYINRHGHLPGMPSAEEVEQDGVNTGELMKNNGGKDRGTHPVRDRVGKESGRVGKRPAEVTKKRAGLFSCKVYAYWHITRMC